MNRLMSNDGDILPASQGTLIYFASYLARTVKHSTIKLYLSAVHNLHVSCGYGDPVQRKRLLQKVLGGILRFQGKSRILRQPVTPVVLAAIQPILRTWLGERDFTMIWAAFTLAFFAFLRCSKFTYNGISQFRPRLICLPTVYHFILVRLARSKCPFSLKLLRQTLIVRVTRWLLRVPVHQFAQLLLCVIIFWPPTRMGRFSISTQVVCLLGPPLLTFLGMRLDMTVSPTSR